MPKANKPRAGSLQFWPRKRATRILPSVNWNPHIQSSSERKTKGLLGFVGYKVGMLRLLVKDLTPHSMTKNKQMVLPATVVECPPMKIFSIRFYKSGIVRSEVIASQADKELSRKLKIPKAIKTLEAAEKNLNQYDDIRVILYTLVSKTGIKKTPDIIEVGISGTFEEKFKLAKELVNKEISVDSIFQQGEIIDIHGVTKGKGLSGPVKRFGIALKQHKSEKGVRKAGSLGPWQPSRVTFRAPLAGQLGHFTRVQFNNKILRLESAQKEDITPKSGFMNYGVVKNHYLVIKGSFQGVSKMPLMLTIATRPTRSAAKQNFEIVRVLK